MISDPLSALLDVVHILEDLEAPYAVGGSVASSVHGEPRASADANLIAELSIQQLNALLERLAGSYYVSEEAARDAFRQSGGTSDRQWRDVLGVLKVQASALDMAYLRRAVADSGFEDLLERALEESTPDDG